MLDPEHTASGLLYLKSWSAMGVFHVPCCLKTRFGFLGGRQKFGTGSERCTPVNFDLDLLSSYDNAAGST